MTQPKVYIAAPYTTDEDIDKVEDVEGLLESHGFSVYSPRLGRHARKLSKLAEHNYALTPTLKWEVFSENMIHIDSAHLVVAISDIDIPDCIFSLGYAYARHVPVISVALEYPDDPVRSVTLSHSAMGHCRGYEALDKGLSILSPDIGSPEDIDLYGQCVAKFQSIYKIDPNVKKELPCCPECGSKQYEKDYVMGMDSGDKICSRCGYVGWWKEFKEGRVHDNKG